jgi:hypothetical protein
MSISVRISRIASDAERRQWSAAVLRLLTECPSDEVWIPLGGPHTDHMLTVDACFAVFASNPSLIANSTLRVYEDIPYAERSLPHMNRALEILRRGGVVMEEELVPIGGAIRQKRRLASVYASQNIEEMCADMEARAAALGSPDHAERLWTVRGLPKEVDPAGILSGAMADAGNGDEIAAWVSRNSDTKRLRILLSMPTGRWASDLELLSGAFPRATFEVYAAPSAVAEVGEAPSDRVEVRSIAGGARAWLSLSLRLSAALKPMPTLFLPGDRRLQEARLLAKLWLRSDTLTAATMDNVVGALAARGRPARRHENVATLK